MPLPDLGLTGCLAAGFAAVGEVVLRRPSRSVAFANESMLVGMGVCAAALFPLTVAFPHRAVVAEAVLIGVGTAWAVSRRLRRSREPAEENVNRPDPAAFAILFVVVVVAAGFASLNFQYQYLWDGFLIWATKAQLLFHSGGLTREWFKNDLYDLRHLAYPPLIPLYEALLSLLRGGFDFDKLKPVFLVFYVSMLVGTYAAARSTVSARLAAVATLLVCLVPALSTRFAAGAYADMPQAAFVAGVVAAGLAGRKESLPWLIGALTTVKAEGVLLAALACAGVLGFWLLESPHGLLRRGLAERRAIAIVALFFLVRFAYVRWIAAPEFVYSGSLSTALERFPKAARLCLLQLLDPRQWGLFWPAFLAAALVLFIRGSNREKALAAAAAAGLILAVAPFLFTSWPMELQIEQAYFRLVAQLAPAAAVVMVCGYARVAHGPVPRRSADAGTVRTRCRPTSAPDPGP
ncbi:MAG: hypothetical protein WAU32_03395 [Thermoanaerobaculia bacterium]